MASKSGTVYITRPEKRKTKVKSQSPSKKDKLEELADRADWIIFEISARSSFLFPKNRGSYNLSQQSYNHKEKLFHTRRVSDAN